MKRSDEESVNGESTLESGDCPIPSTNPDPLLGVALGDEGTTLSCLRPVIRPGREGCGGPCRGAGFLPANDVHATCRAYSHQMAGWIRATIVGMRLPPLDHLGRRPRKGASAAPWTGRAKSTMLDCHSGFVAYVTDRIREELFSATKNERVCVNHLRGFLYRLTERVTLRYANPRAVELEREQLLLDAQSGVVLGIETTNPETILIAAEEERRKEFEIWALRREIRKLPQADSVIAASRILEPKRSYREIAMVLGTTAGAVRLRFMRLKPILSRALRKALRSL